MGADYTGVLGVIQIAKMNGHQEITLTLEAVEHLQGFVEFMKGHGYTRIDVQMTDGGIKVTIRW